MNIGAIGRAAPAINRALTDVVEAPRNIERWQFEKEQMGNQRALGGL